MRRSAKITIDEAVAQETSDKVVLVYKSYVSNTILFRSIAEGLFFANFVQHAFCK